MMLTPPIFLDDICKRDAAYWPKPTHWVADRQQRIRVDAQWQAESGLGFLLELQVQRRQMSPRGRALLPPAACSEPLDRSMTQTCGSARRLRGKGQSTPGPRGCAWPYIPPRPAAVEIAPGSCHGRFTSPIPWGNLFVPGTLIEAPTVSLIFGSRTTRNRQRCIFSAVRCADARLEDLRINSFGTGSGFSRASTEWSG